MAFVDTKNTKEKVNIDPETYVFTFGKYRGWLLKNADTYYIEWCIDNVEWMVFPQDYINKIKERAKRYRSSRGPSDNRGSYFANPFEEMGFDADHQWDYLGG